MVTKEVQPVAGLTEEHEMIRQAARDFAQNEIAPIAAEFDESGEFPLDTVQKMGKMGFMGIEIPEEYGGAGMDTLAYVLAIIEIAKADAAHSTGNSMRLLRSGAVRPRVRDTFTIVAHSPERVPRDGPHEAG